MNILELQHDTTRPYKEVDYRGIEYTVCKDFNHISRYKKLRQVRHYYDNPEDRYLLNRFVTLETQNSYDYDKLPITYYSVPVEYENRLDLISNEFYGTPSYRWVLAQVNNIHDGYTVFEGQLIKVPLRISDLFESGNILAAVPPTSLNLGTE